MSNVTSAVVISGSFVVVISGASVVVIPGAGNEKNRKENID